jgi:hypothetical protein
MEPLVTNEGNEALEAQKASAAFSRQTAFSRSMASASISTAFSIMRALKTSLRRGRATMENLIVDGNMIADIHVIDAEKMNGDTVQVKVIAFFTVWDGEIVCAEKS